MPLNKETKRKQTFIITYTDQYVPKIENKSSIQIQSSPNKSIGSHQISEVKRWRVCSVRGTIYQPLRLGRIWHKVNFKRSLTGLKSEFSFS